MNRKLTCLLFLCIISFQMRAQPIMEDIDRGLVVVDKGNGQLFAAWRFLGTDPDHVGFDLFRNDEKVNTELIINSTNLVFTASSSSSSDDYQVVAYVNEEPIDTSAVASPWSDFYKKIPLTPPAGGTTPDGFNYVYHANDASVGDLDNDGEYEIVLKWQPNNAHDNAHSGYTGNTILEGLEFDGTSLWRINLGINIRSGAHYNPFMVYDLDGDGIAEVACKTADGTTDSKGKVIGNANADYRNSAGYILDGPEFLTVFRGQTGEELVTVDYTPARGNVSDWGDSYGNRVDRFLATIAYLDGNRPSLVMCRGYYTRTVLAAYDFRDGELSSRWVFDSQEGYSDYEGQGAHSISVGDVDNDGKDEIMYGACAIDDDGTGLYNTRMRHGDATHLADIDPEEGGLEFYMVHETADGAGVPGMSVRNAGNGEMQWTIPATGDIGRGLTMDIIPDKIGNEVWSSDGSGVYDKDGNFITGSYPQSAGNGRSFNFGIWWDADLQREILDRSVLNKYNANYGSDRLLTLWQFEGASSNNGTKENPCLTGDLIGDWREEILMRNSESTALILFVNTDETTHKIRTLMHDRQYRLAIAWQNVGYNQPPHPSFYLGEGMEMPARPNIRVAQACLNDLKVLPYGNYTGLELIEYDILDDLTDVDLPWASSLLLFEEDNYEGGAEIIRGSGSCGAISQPDAPYLSAVFSQDIFLEEMEYVIRSKANDQVFTVGQGTGEIVQLADKSNELHQTWNFERVANNEYAILATHSDMMLQPELDLYWIQETPGNPLSDEQVFEIMPSFDDARYFALRNKANRKCFEADPENGTLVCKACDSDSELQLFYEDVFSLNEEAIILHGTAKNKLELYPNPVEDHVRIQGLPVQKVQIFTMEGQLLFTRENLENNKLNLSQLNPGMYLMSIDGRAGQFFTKILKN